MAKTRQQHSIEQALLAVTGAMKIDAIANPTEVQKKQRETAMLKAADVIEKSGIITMAQHGDDGIETAHQVDAVFEAAGVDRVALQRQAAVEGASETIEALQAADHPDQPELE